MPLYTYTARDQSGNSSTGTLEAETGSGAVAQLREKGLWVTDLREDGSKKIERPRRQEVPASAQRDTSVAKRLRSPVSGKDLSIYSVEEYTQLKHVMAKID